CRSDGCAAKSTVAARMVSKPDFRSWLAPATSVSRATMENERPTCLSPTLNAMLIARKPTTGMRPRAMMRARTDNLTNIWAIGIGEPGAGSLDRDQCDRGSAAAAIGRQETGKWLRFDKN